MASLEPLTSSLEAQASVKASVELLVHELVERIKATSNDQNIQKLARDLKASAPALVNAIASKPASG